MAEPEFHGPSDLKGIIHLAGHVGLIVLAGGLVHLSSGTLWQVGAMAVLGIFLSFLFAPLHESVHRTAFRSTWLNDSVAWLAGLIIALPPVAFRAFHLAHHKFTQIEGKDPELEAKKVGTWPDYLIHMTGLRYWSSRLTLLGSHALGRVQAPYYPERLKPRLVREARLYISVYLLLLVGSIASGSTLVLVYWLLPILLGQPFLRAYLLAEHSGLPFVENMRENTRTTLTMAPVRYLAWNMPFHAEHHADPAIPFHELPKAHVRHADRLINVEKGYVGFHASYQRALANEKTRLQKEPGSNLIT